MDQNTLNKINLLCQPQKLSPIKYLIAALSLLSILYIFTITSYGYKDEALTYDHWFWLFPIRQLALLNDITALHASFGFALFLFTIALLTLFSYQRANWSGGMHIFVLFTMIPTVQIFVVIIMMLIPRLKLKDPIHDDQIMNEKTQAALIIFGIFMGMAIIVIAVAISALTLGAYGWGLFVMTPFLSGACTAYLANLGKKLPYSKTFGIVLMSGTIGCFALLMLALEGLMCIILVAPLAGLVSSIGGYFGRAIAIGQNRPSNPLYSLAFLPLVFL